VSGARPFVSICIPAYNAERWLAEALESALRQTYGDFELVLADNASTDATVEIASSFDDPRIRVETAPRTIGAVANHNRAVRLARGELVKFLHADDLLLPKCLGEMVRLASEDDRIGLVFAPRSVVVEEGSDPEWAEAYARPHEHFERLGRTNDGRRLFRELLEGGFDENWIGEPTATLVRRAALERVGLLNERLYQIADLELWARIAYEHRVGFVGRTCSVYRHHEQSGTVRNATTGRAWFDPVWLLEGLLQLPSLELDDRRRLTKLRRSALRRALRSQVARVAQRRWTPELAAYLGFRARTGGRQPKLHPELPPLPVGAQRPAPDASSTASS
jgi:glycosyltransferase involved in cell wall biosynthesis